MIERNGGIASEKTGFHVHVGVGDLGGRLEPAERVLELAETFEDQLFRAATDPTRVYHRGMTHCERVCRARGGFRTLDDLRDMNGKDRLVDFTDVRGETSDHLQWRLWDGSLDLGVMQAQINLSLGLTQAAMDPVRAAAGLPQRSRVGDGDRAEIREGGRRWLEQMRPTMHLLDLLFDDEAQKTQVLTLFASNLWQLP